MNVCIFVGARPNFIKVAPLVRTITQMAEHGDNRMGYQLVYAGRDDDSTLEPSLFADLQIARPDVCLGVDCVNLNELTGLVMSRFEEYLQRVPTDAVVVVDDLASTMAAAIVTKKQGILLAHLAAGTRSFDITMPKEINRLVIDGLSDLLFTAGISNNSIANKEGAELSKVYMVGNILMDNIRHCQAQWQRPAIIDTLAGQDGSHGVPPYLVFTLNRKALLADVQNLKDMVAALLRESEGMTVIAPLRRPALELVSAFVYQWERMGMSAAARMLFVAPMDYMQFGWLTAHARGIVTDSGNVAEEATFNGVPCITLNSYTEHIETVKKGTNVLVGEDAEQLAHAVRDMVAGKWKTAAIPDRWDGRTAERIVQILMEAVRLT